MNKKLDNLSRRIDAVATENVDRGIGPADVLNRIDKRIVAMESDIAQLVRHEAESLFAPSGIWWEKKIFLAADPTTASLDYAAFVVYLEKKFKATKAELKEWNLLVAITQS